MTEQPVAGDSQCHGCCAVAALPEDLGDGSGEGGALLVVGGSVGVGGWPDVTQPRAEQQRLQHVRLQRGQHSTRTALSPREGPAQVGSEGSTLNTTSVQE